MAPSGEKPFEAVLNGSFPFCDTASKTRIQNISAAKQLLAAGYIRSQPA